MAFQPRTILTSCARMSLEGPGYVVQRFLADATLTRAGFEENRVARHALGGDAPYVMLSVIPEGIDFELSITSTDHFKPEEGKSGLRALAVVVSDSMGEAIAKLYFSYFPTEFPARVFNDEATAQAWLAEQLPGITAKAV